MKKILGLFLFFFCLAIAANAQRPQQFEVRAVPELSLPIGDFSKVANTGIGISVKGSYSLKSPGHVLLSIGYQTFGVKTLVPGVTAGYSIIPVMVGYRQDLKKVFLESQVGAGIYRLKAKSTTGTASDSDVKFTFSQSLGYDLGDFEILMRYQGGSLKGGDVLSVIGIGMNYAF